MLDISSTTTPCIRLVALVSPTTARFSTPLETRAVARMLLHVCECPSVCGLCLQNTMRSVERRLSV